VKAVRITSAEIERAKAAANDAGVKLTGFEKRPDGTIKLEFGEYEEEDWRADSPLYEARQ
jgi:hypothetical protein